MPVGPELAFDDDDDDRDALPDAVRSVLAALRGAGHEAVLVGGCVRDRLIGRSPILDWDAATSAAPDVVADLFRNSRWENRFGTVTVRTEPPVEVTSYRAEGSYRDRRRPDDVRFGVPLEDDLGRRDFTINAIAWRPTDLEGGRGQIVDPFGGVADLAASRLRTVGDPRARFAEDALRLVRAARFAGVLGLTIEPSTEAAIVDLAPTVSGVSAERVRDELFRILERDPRPSAAVLMLERLGLLAVVLPELAALRGVPQRKAVPGDALDHTLAAVDAARAEKPPLTRLAALLHDVGKASTLADGHFIGHETVGADLARGALERLRVPHGIVDRVVGAIRQHMYGYDAAWSDAAVRRFIRRLGSTDRDLLFALRRADNAASGLGERGDRNQDELERRVDAEIRRAPALLVDRRLAIDGHDLQEVLGMDPGPLIGQLLTALTDVVLDDPAENERERLLAVARRHLATVVQGRTEGADHRSPGADSEGDAATIGRPESR